MRTDREIAEEVLRRAEVQKHLRRERQTGIIHAVLAAAACFAAVIGLSLVISRHLFYFRLEEPAAAASLFATGSEASYILTGALSFLIGAAAVLLCMKLVKPKNHDGDRPDTESDEERNDTDPMERNGYPGDRNHTDRNETDQNNTDEED